MATQLRLVQEIIQNAVAATSADSWVPPIRLDVLAAPEKIVSDALLDPKRYGVIVRSDKCGGVLLPDIPQVTSTAQQLASARRKAAIRPDEPVELSRFEVMRYH